MKALYKVSGMTCGGCAHSVTRAIEAIKPDAKIRVKVNLSAATVSVEGLDDEAAIGEAVRRAGYEFGGRVE